MNKVPNLISTENNDYIYNINNVDTYTTYHVDGGVNQLNEFQAVIIYMFGMCMSTEL